MLGVQDEDWVSLTALYGLHTSHPVQSPELRVQGSRSYPLLTGLTSYWLSVFQTLVAIFYGCLLLGRLSSPWDLSCHFSGVSRGNVGIDKNLWLTRGPISLPLVISWYGACAASCSDS